MPSVDHESRIMGHGSLTLGLRPRITNYVIWILDIGHVVMGQGIRVHISLMLDHGGWFDRKTGSFRAMVDVQICSAMGPPGGGRNPITQRFVRHFNLLGLTPFDEDSLKRIYTTILTSWSTNGNMEISGISDSIVSATVCFFRIIFGSMFEKKWLEFEKLFF